MRRYFDVLRRRFNAPIKYPMPSARPQRIALLIDTSVTFSSLVIRGVARYAREQPTRTAPDADAIPPRHAIWQA
jgi:hypothetical protein